ncbi:GntR family transcriptional regulator [Pontiellaceae bacterium B12227]|nr:GntR family transcriptional regulator [Pontiellaceae bacterium B12227]
MKSLPEKIAANITQEIITGNRLSKGDRLPTFREIQKLFEVSTSTINQAFSILEKEGFVELRRGSGCFVKRIPETRKRLASSPAQICAIFPNFSTHSSAFHIYQGIEKAAQQYGYSVTINSNTSYEQEKEQVLGQIKADGGATILYPMPRTVKQFRTDYLKPLPPDSPLILLDICYPEQNRTSVVFDNYQAGYEITRRLIQEGHSRIVFKRLKSRDREFYHRSNDDRFKGYMAALKRAGLPVFPELYWSEQFTTDTRSPNPQFSQEFLKEWANTPKSSRPTAVITLEDMHAATLINTAIKMGIEVPNDLRIIGFDNLQTAQAMTPAPFPTTAPDFHQMGSLAVSIMDRILNEGPQTAVQYMLPVPLKWTPAP